MRHLLILAIVLLLSACGPQEDIPGGGYEPSAVEIVPAAQPASTPHGSPHA